LYCIGVDACLVSYRNAIREKLHKVLQEEPALEEPMYGMLAALDIEQGKPFAPDARMKAILERAAKAGRAQMLVDGFASSRPDRVVWTDRKWEWAALRYENGDFELPTGIDVEAPMELELHDLGMSTTEKIVVGLVLAEPDCG
jgi:hypothetical protein